jgi:hypothetical protein
MAWDLCIQLEQTRHIRSNSKVSRFSSSPILFRDLPDQLSENLLMVSSLCNPFLTRIKQTPRTALRRTNTVVIFVRFYCCHSLLPLSFVRPAGYRDIFSESWQSILWTRWDSDQSQPLCLDRGRFLALDLVTS